MEMVSDFLIWKTFAYSIYSNVVHIFRKNLEKCLSHKNMPFPCVYLKRNSLSYFRCTGTHTQTPHYQYKLKIKLKRRWLHAKFWDTREEEAGWQSPLPALIFSSHLSLLGRGAGMSILYDLFLEWRHKL